MKQISFIDGLLVSGFSMLIVFLLLIGLAFIVSLLKYLPAKSEKLSDKEKKVQTQPVREDDEEERMVAMLIASCLAKDEIKKDVKVISCERIR